LALLIDAQHQGAIRRIQVQAHHVAHLFLELRIVRQLEPLHPVWLHIVFLPNLVDDRPAYA
jgi:hypothetical protein